MAKENFVLLHGQIYDRPKIYVNDNEQPVKAAFALRVYRRGILNGRGEVDIGKSSYDYPVIMTTDTELIKECCFLRKGDLVDVRGVFTTRDVTKKVICPNGHEIEWPGSYVFVTPIYICRRETELSEDKGSELIRKRAEVSNVVIIIGRICRDIDYWEDGDHDPDKQGRHTCHISLSSKRRYHIRDGIHDAEKVDFPIVVVSGRNAEDCHKYLHKGSLIEIYGAIQTRQHQREKVCPICEESVTFNELALEIYGYSVEYLHDCDFPEPAESDGNYDDKTTSVDGGSNKQMER